MRAVLISIAVLGTACGPDVIRRETRPADMMMDPKDPVVSGLSNRVFEIDEADVFGIASGVELEIGTLAGTPESGPFALYSLGNSDEAAGTLTASPCEFSVTTSSFPGNARVVAGARIALSCAFDAQNGVLRLTDPASNVTSEGQPCEGESSRGVPCIPPSGG